MPTVRRLRPMISLVSFVRGVGLFCQRSRTKETYYSCFVAKLFFFRYYHTERGPQCLPSLTPRGITQLLYRITQLLYRITQLLYRITQRLYRITQLLYRKRKCFTLQIFFPFQILSHGMWTWMPALSHPSKKRLSGTRICPYKYAYMSL